MRILGIEEIQSALEKAIDTGAIIEITYTKGDGTSSIRRLSEVEYSDEFARFPDVYAPSYIKAFCHLRKEQRTFRIDRISNVTFINKPGAASDQSVLITPSNVEMPYIFDRSKRVFALYGIDYNN